MLKTLFARFTPLDVKIESVAKRRIIMLAMLPMLVIHPVYQSVEFAALAVFHTIRFTIINTANHIRAFGQAWVYRAEAAPRHLIADASRVIEHAPQAAAPAQVEAHI